MAGYVELHAHSCWSLREGASTPEELLLRARTLGYEALALTDHDNLYGAMEFARAAHDAGVRPITGCEVTMAPRTPGGEPSHLTLLAADVHGYRNLCRLLTRAFCTHGKDEPRVEWPWLFEHKEGLIVLSGCRRGALALLLDPVRGTPRWREARSLAGELRDVFGEAFFIELQHHDVYGDRQRVAALTRVAASVGVPVVATNNVHYHVRERHRLHDVLVAIRHRLTLDASHEVRRPNSEFFLKAPEAMMRRFSAYPEAVRNTLAIAERCTF
ncbi:MAG: PHP domain-containing protein, partial [Chloroflexota bacterium]|nr:PHP domain-containing protein [Chloroflexota bacterium]